MKTLSYLLFKTILSIHLFNKHLCSAYCVPGIVFLILQKTTFRKDKAM